MDLTLALPDGRKLPQFGLGTWQVTDESALCHAIEVALDEGYKLIDTAFVYGNERIIGDVLKKRLDSGKLRREDVFVTSKLWLTYFGSKELVKQGLKLSLKALQLDYIDLYLIHWPIGLQFRGDENNIPQDEDGKVLLDKESDITKIWQALEECVDEGLIKSIGVSNFNISQLQRIQAVARHPLCNNQVELNVFLQQKALVDFCKSNNITVTAYSPLGSPASAAFWEGRQYPPLLQDETVQGIAAKRGKTAAQVVLRFLIQEGIAIVPKSVTPSRIVENSQLSDFVLTGEEMEELRRADRNMRLLYPSVFKPHPEYPFHDDPSAK